MKIIHVPAAPSMSVAKSFGATALVLLVLIVCGAVLLLKPWLGGEATFLVYYMLGMPISLLFVCRLRGIRLARASFDLRLLPPSMLLPLALGSVALLFGVSGPISSALPVPEATENALAEMAGQTGFLTFLFFVIAAPILEEAIFRGVILDGLLRRYSPQKSILLSSFLFGAVHLNAVQFVTGMVIGLFAGWVYYRSRSLLACIAIHLAANGSGFIVRLFLAAKTETASDSALAGSYDDFGVMLGIMAAGLVVVLLCVRSLRRQFDELGPAPAWAGPSSDGP
jgi:uncharacterized protein